MNTDGIDALDLKASALKLVDDETKRSRGISTGEDIFIHEETPDEILKLPSLAKTSDLEEEDTIIFQHIVDLTAERAEVANTDVLSHLETGDLVVLALRNRNVTVIHAENLTLALFNASLAETIVAPSSLVATKGNTSNLSTVVYAGILGEGSPAAANIEHPLALLETNLFADDAKLVVLELLKALLLVNIRDNARGVDHAWAKEPAVEVVTTVIMATDLLLVYANVS